MIKKSKVASVTCTERADSTPLNRWEVIYYGARGAELSRFVLCDWNFNGTNKSWANSKVHYAGDRPDRQALTAWIGLDCPGAVVNFAGFRKRYVPGKNENGVWKSGYTEVVPLA